VVHTVSTRHSFAPTSLLRSRQESNCMKRYRTLLVFLRGMVIGLVMCVHWLRMSGVAIVPIIRSFPASHQRRIQRMLAQSIVSHQILRGREVWVMIQFWCCMYTVDDHPVRRPPDFGFYRVVFSTYFLTTAFFLPCFAEATVLAARAILLTDESTTPVSRATP